MIEQHINDEELIGKMFYLLKFVYKHIKNAAARNESTGTNETEELFRKHAQSAIHCLSRIDRQGVNVHTVDLLICAILQVDKELQLIRHVSLKSEINPKMRQ